jgi:hypothetical protein
MYCNTKGIVPGDHIAYGTVGCRDWIRNERRLAGPVHTQSTHLLLSTLLQFKYSTKYSRTQLIWMNWEAEPFTHAENPDN